MRKPTNPRTGSERLSGIGLKVMWEIDVPPHTLDVLQAFEVQDGGIVYSMRLRTGVT